MISQAGQIADGAPPAGASRAAASSEAWAKWLPLVFAAGVLALYAPTLAVAAHEWMINDNYAHGIFIFPLCAFLLWLRRDELRGAERRPTAWGLAPLAVGVIGQCLSYMLQIKYVGMWTLALTLTGGVLVLYGPAMLPFVRFAILFSLLAYPLPHSVLTGLTTKIQYASTVGATALMHALGYPLIQEGNVIQVPGATLEVAEACSGFHKLLSLTAFTLLYSYLFTTSQGKRLVLILAVLPLALLVNVLRISFLIAEAGRGLPALHAAHDGAEYGAIVLAFGLLIGLGRVLGCRTMPLLPLIGCALVLSAVGADYGLGQMAVPKSRRLPVETFPAVIGPWEGGPVQDVGADIQKRLPTAKIVERLYTNSAVHGTDSLAGQGVDLMLLTATEDEDMHSPQACFPSQGWNLDNVTGVQVDGQPATQMTAEMPGQGRLAVLYWLTGYYPPAPPRNALVRKAYAWRMNALGGHNNMSLFVRLTASDTPLGRRALADFTASLHGPLQSLVGTGANSSEEALHHRRF